MIKLPLPDFLYHLIRLVSHSSIILTQSEYEASLFRETGNTKIFDRCDITSSYRWGICCGIILSIHLKPSTFANSLPSNTFKPSFNISNSSLFNYTRALHAVSTLHCSCILSQMYGLWSRLN